ncbi:hypothetical protein SLEP1_g56711 [Rubroshorea leprosula]|uniref:Uncharacterized protein n=1 Tax=Rubroshorea leprosula TaxID=152421 RepID=A0AAV5MKK9_9ROSI|nr:hypothetical protein SLEP1_g56711 [Rubroshorea leprosula]
MLVLVKTDTGKVKKGERTSEKMKKEEQGLKADKIMKRMGGKI